jgi:hypothetical protein
MRSSARRPLDGIHRHQSARVCVPRSKFWEAYRDVPAWSFARFLEIADCGSRAPPNPGRRIEAGRQREREDLEASVEYTRKLLGL